MPIYESKTTYIQQRCKSISETLLKLQDHRKLESIGEKLILDEHLYINKNDFRLYKDSFPLQKIETYINS